MVDKFPPLPADDGGKLRSAEILQRLSELGEVVLCCFDRDGVGPGEYESLGVRLRTVPLRRSPTSIVRGTARTGSGSAGRFWDVGLAAVVKQALSDSTTDLLQVEHGQLAPYLTLGPARLRVLDLHNVDSQLAASYARSGRSLRARTALLEARLLRRLERRAAAAADVVITVSKGDAASLAGTPRELLVCPNGWRSGDPAPPADEPVVIFTALFSWRPNVEAALWFVRRVWPLVVRQRPEATLLLVGRDPTSEVRALAQPNVEVTGTVPDVRPYLARARLAIAPLQAGGGTRLKVLEALDAGRPVVATSVGIAGLEDLVGCGVIVEDGPNRMAAAVADLLGDPAGAVRLGSAGSAAVRARYAWEDTLSPLLERVQR